MSMKTVLATLVASSLAGPALALSCLPHDVTDSYTQAAEAEASYVVVHGRLVFDETRLPKVDMSNQAATPESTRIPALISGKSLSKQGFERRFEAPISLDIECAGPWCAGAKSGIDYLAFLRVEPDGSYALALNPCGGQGFGEPSQEQLDQILACHTGGPCLSGLIQLEQGEQAPAE
ncbi:hypothetical protein [Roseovarius nubinhibens]|uniref:hypothetical protein n=1 Tax=Roseovarius nubinhibens TaxID=314263 RepID=UPI001FE309A4|nr:hypothetical protein [Roseovarius nubinhibens]